MELKLRYKKAMDKSLYIQDNHQFIMSLILKGTPIENILRTLGVDSSRFNSFFTNKPVQTILGNKDETYFNEEDLLTENYNFNIQFIKKLFEISECEPMVSMVANCPPFAGE